VEKECDILESFIGGLEESQMLKWIYFRFIGVTSVGTKGKRSKVAT
jgi:hypothetical protein